ncbi:MAG: hypothetical protein GXY44_15115 [Phycisphaerales bacterium]|nr:hypothetical protein [Phycisphaerales bacterium]
MGSLHDTSPDLDPGSVVQRPWIGVQFECCDVYARVYRNQEATAYVGRCPRCLRKVQVRVGPGGTDTRMFRAR